MLLSTKITSVLTKVASVNKSMDVTNGATYMVVLITTVYRSL